MTEKRVVSMGWQDKVGRIPRPYRINIVLYLLAGLSTIALVGELAVGGRTSPGLIATQSVPITSTTMPITTAPTRLEPPFVPIVPGVVGTTPRQSPPRVNTTRPQKVPTSPPDSKPPTTDEPTTVAPATSTTTIRTTTTTEARTTTTKPTTTTTDKKPKDTTSTTSAKRR